MIEAALDLPRMLPQAPEAEQAILGAILLDAATPSELRLHAPAMNDRRGIGLNAQSVRDVARGRWRDILGRLGIAVPKTPKQHGPCPACGGKDRFRFDDLEGRGTWFCNQCDPQAGDGVALVQNILACEFRQALQFVADEIGYSPSIISTAPKAKQAESSQQRPQKINGEGEEENEVSEKVTQLGKAQNRLPLTTPTS